LKKFAKLKWPEKDIAFPARLAYTNEVIYYVLIGFPEFAYPGQEMP
jgi:hypothetical protein